VFEDFARHAVPYRIVESDVAFSIPDIPMLDPQVVCEQAPHVGDVARTLVLNISGIDGGFEQGSKIPVVGTLPMLARPNPPSFGFVVKFPNLPVIFS
jgi:hypothetical protein